MEVLFTATAWDLIGWDHGNIRIKGGRAFYEGVLYNCGTSGEKVKIARLEGVIHDGRQCIKEVSRYVDPETRIEVLAGNPTTPKSLQQFREEG